MLATLVIPSQIYPIPHFLLFKYLGQINTYKPLIVPSFLAARQRVRLSMRSMFSSFASSSRASRERFPTPPCWTAPATRKSTATSCCRWPNRGRTRWRVVITVVAMNFIYHWQDFMRPLIYLNDFEKFPIALGLRMYQTMEGDWVNYLMAASLLSLAPVALLFIFAQRFITRGMILSGLRQ